MQYQNFAKIVSSKTKKMAAKSIQTNHLPKPVPIESMYGILFTYMKTININQSMQVNTPFVPWMVWVLETKVCWLKVTHPKLGPKKIFPPGRILEEIDLKP